jgi:hypothetical protein
VVNLYVLTRLVSKKYRCLGNGSVLCLALSLQFGLVSTGLAGPPLATDDPGILDPGDWEVIVAISGEEHHDGKEIHAPLLDISLGTGSNSQISFSLPRVVVNPEEDARQSGFAYASAGFKWRFISKSNWDWAIASNYTVPVSNEIITPDGPEDISVLGVPLLASRTIGEWIWYGQLGWNIGSDGASFWDYGLAVSHPLGGSTHWMMEVFGNAVSSFGLSSLNYQLGLDYEINHALHLLASAGTGIKSGSEHDSRLDYSFYIGMQWFH